ncbi:MAG: AMP-binding protein [Gordonia sp. (in: high G+C Gram-positive bacteria)]|uniref:AMP-binding protein n=1 Tax=Gordonia sp. (in: high G+C Gram-positive bacteria) TaxID=84139 RepID=UPI0039E4F802
MSRGSTVRGDGRQWLGAAVALVASGVLRPPGPRTAIRLATSAVRFGATPAVLLGLSAARHPDRVAVIDEWGPVTYRDLLDTSSSVSAHLRRVGCGRGGSVGILCRNHRGFLVALAAAAQTGADIVSINTEVPPQQLDALLTRHRPDVLVHDREFAEAIGVSGWSGIAILADPDADSDTGAAVDSLWSIHRDPPRPVPPSRMPGRFVLLTSGTTGLAKGVPRKISLWAVLQLAATGVSHVDLRAGDVAYVGPPFFHGFGLLGSLGVITVGGTVVCRRRFDAEQMLDDMRRHRVNVLIAVPVMLQRLVAVPDLAEKAKGLRLRVALTGAAPITTATVRAFRQRFGDVLVNGYGSTEAGIVSIASPEDLAKAPNTAGRPGLGVSIRIVDAHDRPVPPGTGGRIVVRGPLDYDGYTPDRAAAPTAKRIVDGHVDTGDLGHLDDDGLLFIDGRGDDMVVSGGENVFPREVEDALTAHPEISDAVVLGVDDDEYGQVLNAYLVSERKLADDEIKEHLRSRLERYKVPKAFIRIDAVPRNAAGKVLRGELARGS